MAKLADSISIRSRFARSANLERDIARSEPLDGYIVTPRALDVVQRIASTAATGSAGGAWSLTGPYGSGKSSLALILDAAFGEVSDLRGTALGLIEDASPDVGTSGPRGAPALRDRSLRLPSGLVTAGREPLNRTILWALYGAVLRSYGEIPSVKGFRAAKALKGALEDAETDDPRRTGPSPSALVETARCLAEDVPLLLVIDEFGKNLEAIRDGGDADPYLLQQLAEAGQGSGLPIFVLTLQHLSFEDHLAGADNAQRREWAKVQGRFEDVAFVESASQTRALIGTVFDVRNDSLHVRINRWASMQAKAMRELGLSELADAGTVASCYPLHPLTTLVLPELCSRHGQHERTLFSFLASSHERSASSFLATTVVPDRGALPTLGLDAVYDYFVGSSALNIESSRLSGRWAEIATRLRDSHGLTTQQAQLAKAVALLNLVSTTGTIRASRPMLRLVARDSDATLDELEGAGVVTYRDFADEYRVWQGTDVDIRLLLNRSRHQVEQQPLAEILREVDQPEPIVAARHSAQNDILRVFRRRYAEPDEQVEPLEAFSRYDGEVLLVVGSNGHVPTLTRSWAATKPIVAAVPADLRALDDAAREVATVQVALDDSAVLDDWVARAELGERLAQARVALDHALTSTFGSDACRWLLLAAQGESELVGGRGSAAISDAADDAYPETPRVGNEMLNRTELTSQGAKARGLLIAAMIEHGAASDLGMDGYGPEVAMYRAFLERTKLHGRDERNDLMVFRNPTDDTLRPAWDMLQDEFKRATSRRINLSDVYAALMSPPFGMKAGAIPVLVTAALIASSDEVAIYEHGTFKPVLTSEMSERMVRNPGHFDIKHFANTTGARRQVIDALAQQLDLRPSFRKHRVANVLTVVGHLVARINRLDNFTRRTQSLRASTVKARQVLMAAVEPDQLLFASLPQALGFPPVRAGTQAYPKAHSLATSVADVMNELAECFSRLLDDQLELLLEISSESSRDAVALHAAALEDEVLDPSVRALVLSLANSSIDDDKDWIKAIATVVAKKAPAEWTDEDLGRFQRELHHQIAAFRRLVALHADRRANGGGPFEAYRVTITKPDGTDLPLLVGVDQEVRPEAELALKEALLRFTVITGSRQRAHETLLALLGEGILPNSSSQDEDRVVSDILNARASND